METKATKKIKLHVRKGDNVQVIAGNAKGNTGVIKEVLTGQGRVIIDGVNLRTKHVKPNANNPQGGIIKIEGSIHISNVKVIDPSTGKATRIGRKLNDKGKLQRYSKQSGKFI
jgi:large subunit ribosomal protein L24